MVGLDETYQPSVVELAQAGNLRAIGYWINSFLVPQGIYVRVGISKSGCLHLMVEFERYPDRERLVRYICHRLCYLKCSLFNTVRIAARPIGSTRVLWSRSVRLLSARRSSTSPRPPAHFAKTTAKSTSSNLVIYKPRRSSAAEMRRRRQRSLAVGGSAAAALMLGYGFKAISDRPPAVSTAPRQSPPASRAISRSNVVNTADDSVVVTQQLVNNPADPTVTLTFSNDSALGSVERQPLSWELSRGSDYRDADVILANLESSLSAATEVLQSPDSTDLSLESLTAGSVDVVNLGSDRLLEAGSGELAQTLNALEQAGIRSVGAGRNQREARRPEILDVKGQRIAYLGYSDSVTNAAKGWRAGTNPAVNEQIAADIQAIRNQVDWVIVNYHWSQELADYPGDWQMNMARFAIDQGADLVVGHHPNVLQGAEIYKGRAIAYSLGNFIFADPENASQQAKTDYDTAVLKVSLRDRQMRLEFLPIQVSQSKPEVATGEKAEQVLHYLQQASGLFDQPMQSPTVLDVRSSEFAPIAPPQPAPVPVTPSPLPTEPTDSFTAPPAAEPPTRSESFTAPAAPMPIAPSDSFTAPPESDSFTAPPESDSFTAPAAPSPESDAFTTYPTLPTDQMEEIKDDDRSNGHQEQNSQQYEAFTPSEASLAAPSANEFEAEEPDVEFQAPNKPEAENFKLEEAAVSVTEPEQSAAVLPTVASATNPAVAASASTPDVPVDEALSSETAASSPSEAP